MNLLSIEDVLAANEWVQQDGIGVTPCAVDMGKLEGAIARIENHIYYEATDDIYLIAALYIEAIGKAHAFSDWNKRTALASALVYLKSMGYIPESCTDLAYATESLVEGEINREQMANILVVLCTGFERVEGGYVQDGD